MIGLSRRPAQTHNRFLVIIGFCVIRWIARAFAAALVLSGFFIAPGHAEPIEIDAKPIVLDPSEPDRIAIGELIYRGGLALASDDARFGGLSGLTLDADGASFIAITDAGNWLRGRLRHDADGNLAGIEDAAISPILSPAGKPLREKREADAESLTRLADGGLLVGFERQHRLWRYPPPPATFDNPATPQPIPGGVAGAPPNKGIEALATSPDGRLFIALEGLRTAPNRLAAWVGGANGWAPVEYQTADEFVPTGADALASGELFVLERRFTVIGGIAARLRRFSIGEIRAGGTMRGSLVASLHPPVSVDNMEGIAVTRDPAGRTNVYLIADDNFNPLQRTVLLMFEIREPARD